jgi:hypothetical protein
MDIGRQKDIAELKKDLKKADPVMRKNIEEAGDKIRKEQGDGFLRSARESLLKAKHQGKQEDVRDISEQIYRHTRHQKDVPIGKTSFFFSLPNSFFK